MKTKFLIILSVVLLGTFINCQSSQFPAKSSHNSLDWSGLYKGVIPSTTDGCSGEVVLLTINKDLTYTQQSACIETPDKATAASGTFTWNRLGSEITLINTATKAKTTYQVNENQLKKISENGKRVTYTSSDLYDLKKVQINKITGKYWKLIEINGNPADGNYNREPHIIFKNDKRVNGAGGCNVFNGSYELQQSTGRLKISKVITTQMACINMEIEGELLRVLEEVDNYTLSEDGTVLSLNKARMAPLARFEVVYLK